MNMQPLSAAYKFFYANHCLEATVNHQETEREVCFYYDKKLISKIQIPNGDLLSDDDYIMKLVEDHCRNSIDAFADLFKNHTDKILLNSKTVNVVIYNMGIEILANVSVYYDRYDLELSTPNGENKIFGSFKANNFSEVLEKLRLFISTLSGVSTNLSAHIDEICDDKIEGFVQWSPFISSKSIM